MKKLDEYLKTLKIETISTSKLFELSEHTIEYVKKDSKGIYTIEIITRPPGVRLLIVNNNKILLTKEYRFEIDGWDYRLPGGRVYDTIKPYLKNKDKNKLLLNDVHKAVINEAEEEAGIKPIIYELLHIDKLGASIFWDLYYFKVSKFEITGKKESNNVLDVGEIIYPEWFSYDEVFDMCLNNNIHESRTVGFLLKYILNEKNKS